MAAAAVGVWRRDADGGRNSHFWETEPRRGGARLGRVGLTAGLMGTAVSSGSPLRGACRNGVGAGGGVDVLRGGRGLSQGHAVRVVFTVTMKPLYTPRRCGLAREGDWHISGPSKKMLESHLCGSLRVESLKRPPGTPGVKGPLTRGGSLGSEQRGQYGWEQNQAKEPPG